MLEDSEVKQVNEVFGLVHRMRTILMPLVKQHLKGDESYFAGALQMALVGTAAISGALDCNTKQLDILIVSVEGGDFLWQLRKLRELLDGQERDGPSEEYLQQALRVMDSNYINPFDQKKN
ncbi:hypothetical protein LCGC14_1137760 [marine sediment metagenome]|uniref:Uncharacterized protein n=1 Tax=marine sediment metagenome TaxID=412755 RepID=A0A0F9MM52_9ZZZZ